MDIADEVQLARIALASDDDELATLALAKARRRAELNPAVASIVATAAYVSGLWPSTCGSGRPGTLAESADDSATWAFACVSSRRNPN
jgi:hypothetical protein